jgi:hypothetical protein
LVQQRLVGTCSGNLVNLKRKAHQVDVVAVKNHKMAELGQ